jgi:DNA-binding transcriptional LysR family regulator
MDVHSVDFAALRVLRMVHAHGSFTRAAEALGSTQSAVSYTIDRLRRAFDDPLFVRQGTGTVPTERCLEIVAEAGQLLDQFLALAEPRAFEPAHARAEVTLSCNYYERATMVPHLIRNLRRSAPGLRLNIIASSVQGKQQLSRGESDLLVGPIRIKESGFYGRRLLEDHYVCVIDAQNPLADATLSAEIFAATPQVVVTYGGNWRSSYLVEMDAQGLAPNVAVEVPSPANLPQLIMGTDLLGTVPRRVAQAYGPGVKVLPCPFPAAFAIDLYWTARTHHAPMHRWLRGQIAQTVGAL